MPSCAVREGSFTASIFAPSSQVKRASSQSAFAASQAVHCRPPVVSRTISFAPARFACTATGCCPSLMSSDCHTTRLSAHTLNFAVGLP